MSASIRATVSNTILEIIVTIQGIIINTIKVPNTVQFYIRVSKMLICAKTKFTQIRFKKFHKEIFKGTVFVLTQLRL